MSLFLNKKYELRSGWKFATYAAFYLLILVATGMVLSILVTGSERTESQLTILALNEIALFVPAVAAMRLTVRFLDHRPLQAFGVGFLPRWPRDLLSGLGLACGMLAVLIAGCYIFGIVSMRWTGRQVPAGTLIGTFSLLLLAAVTEELVFRGFPLQLLMEGMGEWPGIIGMSAFFGAIHLKNPNASLLGAINTAVAGVLLSLAYVRTRSLWQAYGIHAGWNVGLGFVFGFPLSGWDMASLWTTGIAGRDAILGGDYGPEGGLLATFVFAASAVIVERRRYGPVDSTQTVIGSRAGRDHRNRAGDSG